jgi:ATP-dependent helicase Lhr and Lhr-like helicase
VEVRHGRTSVGQIHQSSFIARDGKDPILLLGGRSWRLVEIDWKRRVAQVVPAAEEGRSRWVGSGHSLSYAVSQAIKRVLCGEGSDARLSRRAESVLTAAREELSWPAPEATMLIEEGGRTRWWTFAGTLANRELSWRLGPCGGEGADELSVAVRAGVTSEQVKERLEADAEGELPIDERAVEELKFAECLPRSLAQRVVRARTSDSAGVAAAVSSPIWSRASGGRR